MINKRALLMILVGITGNHLDILIFSGTEYLVFTPQFSLEMISR